jgi:hypothetical protein
MNSKVFFRRVVRANLLAFLCWMVVAAGAMAQLPGGGNAGMNASLLQLFGDIPGFTAQAEVQLREKGAKTPTSMPMGFSALSGNVRLDIDMGRIKSDQVTPDMLAGFKTLGLDRLATVIRKDRKAALCPVLAKLDSASADDIRPLFMGRAASAALPPRAGYYVGYLVASEIGRTMPLKAPPARVAIPFASEP